MALGGGTFVSQNKTLPGSYINFISTNNADASISDRGVAAIGIDLNWGEDGKIIELTAGDFQKNSMKILGVSYADDSMKGLRDLFKNANKAFIYRLNGGGDKASNNYAEAKYSGTKGNDIKIVISTNLDVPTMFDVKTFIGNSMADSQTVADASGLKANDFVIFKSDATLSATAGTALSGGTNGTTDAASHQAFLDAAENYSFNAIGVVSETDAINSLYAAYCKRLRDEQGMKFQCVCYNTAADYEGVVNVKNDKNLVYWALGVIAGTAVNKSALNKIYDGEYTISADYTQSQLESAIKDGEFTLHKVGDNLRVLADINSLKTITEDKGEIFKSNQTIRVVDQIANDTASIFSSKYVGNVPNDASGRTSLWGDIVKILLELRNIRAIESFNEDEVIVSQGAEKVSVTIDESITVIGTMSKLYMTCVVS